MAGWMDRWIDGWANSRVGSSVDCRSIIFVDLVMPILTGGPRRDHPVVPGVSEETKNVHSGMTSP